MNLTPHFTLEELVYSDTAIANGFDNTPTQEVLVRLTQLALVMEAVRSLCGNNAVAISSGYRSPPVNAAVGGASNSAHLYGCACDFTIPAFGSPIDICKQLEPHLQNLRVDQLIHENISWVHLGLANPPWDGPRHQCLTINGGSTVNGFV